MIGASPGCRGIESAHQVRCDDVLQSGADRSTGRRGGRAVILAFCLALLVGGVVVPSSPTEAYTTAYYSGAGPGVPRVSVIGDSVGSGIRWTNSYAPLSRLLPRCAALVHHGGIGTLAQALAAGVPQLTMPMGFDQPDNAARLVRLGVAGWVTPARFTGERVATELQRLITDPQVAAACSRWANALKNSSAIERACDLLEELEPTRHAVSETLPLSEADRQRLRGIL